MQKMLGIDDVCTLLGVSVMTLYRFRQNNGFPHPAIKIGKKLIRWNPSQIEEWVAQQGPDSTHKS
jgi:excisionase family DNA binding protein